ncbi:MAG: hypothetical protein CM1200mP11_4600 [Nitrosopumilaceae archaeon]|nr:MAG: hypothetical protein CM1200mP11_4600 [Nitrosopumilaceae archaeon]
MEFPPEIDGHAGRFFNYLINGDFENMDPFRKRSDFKVNIKEFEREGKKIQEDLSISGIDLI